MYDVSQKAHHRTAHGPASGVGVGIGNRHNRHNLSPAMVSMAMTTY